MTDQPNTARAHAGAGTLWRVDVAVLAAGLVAFLLVVALGYRFNYEFVCRDVFPVPVCQFLSLAVPRALSLAVVLSLVVLTRSDIAALHRRALRPRVSGGWAMVLAGGLGLTLIPLLALMASGSLLPPFAVAACWTCGLAMTALGLPASLYAPDRLRRTDRAPLRFLGIAAVSALLLPDVALLLQPVWRLEALTDLTFGSVVGFLGLLGHAPVGYSATKIIMLDDFGVAVGKECSGVEGFALITAFMLLYIGLLRDQLRLGRALLLLPIGLLLSWCLNVLRISVLVLIGRFVSADLAVDGFHSHAGWLAFMALALGLAITAHSIGWFRKAVDGAEPARPARPPLMADPAMVMILPFAVFMASATLVSAVSVTPGLLYPLRAAAMAAILAAGWRVIRCLEWRPDIVALASGAGCGVLWILTAPASEAGDSALSLALAGLPAGLFVLWVAARVIGTAVLVPMVEEFFFRGYLQPKLAGALGDGLMARAVGVAVAAGLFGALHDRWLAAGLAGVLFGLLALRRGRLADAVWAHAAANTVIAAAAVASGAWHLI